MHQLGKRRTNVIPDTIVRSVFPRDKRHTDRRSIGNSYGRGRVGFRTTDGLLFSPGWRASRAERGPRVIGIPDRRTRLALPKHNVIFSVEGCGWRLGGFRIPSRAFAGNLKT